ncbi:MAG: PAS domain S-box protein [Chloroflexi bacterium]|nr:PAS domain S-box protein [Chloroflexota bacterium]
MMNLTRPPEQARLDATLVRLQIALPVGIAIAVAVYAGIFEILLVENVPRWTHFILEFLIFGLFGAVAVWVALGWVRRLVDENIERDRQARAQERLLATITANSADAILLLDNEGCVKSWNRGAELLFGYQPSEIVGKHFAVLVPADRTAEIERIHTLLHEKGFVRDWITQRLTRDGRKLTVELTRTLLRDENGAVIGSSSTLHDVTAREKSAMEVRELNRQLETLVAQRTRELAESNRELRRRQYELEKANAELKQLDELKSEFVSLVSHELRAPLANISGSLELLLSDASSLTTNQRDLLSLANDQAARLTRLVRGILNVSRIEAGQTLLQMQAFDLTALIERLCEQWQLCDNEHIWIADTPGNLPSVWADRDRIEEVLTNLMENAYKYSDPDTEIRVRSETRDGEMVIAVSDQGKGIESEDLHLIFDKFYRVERDDARKTYGYGLGLYISIKLVEAMGGRLWAESEIGKGSTFYFSLPLAGHSAAAHPQAMAFN